MLCVCMGYVLYRALVMKEVINFYVVHPTYSMALRIPEYWVLHMHLSLAISKTLYSYWSDHGNILGTSI